jgi:polysaccharide export outer membrane protein
MNMWKNHNLATILAVLSLALCRTGAAQETNSAFSVRDSRSTITPEDVVRRFEAPEMTSYTLGNGDEISVDVWNHPELSGHHVIGPDGKISLPVSGTLDVAGLTREESQKAIASAFSRFYSDLSVTMRVDRYTSYRVYVLGRAGNPGMLQFDTQPTLLDVITRAAVLQTPGSSSASSPGLGRCAILRGRDQMVWVDLRALFTQGNMALNIRLQRDDVVYLRDSGDRVVYVLGEVKHPGAYQLTPTMSFLDAYSQAGGSTEDASDNKIEIVRSSSGVQREFRLSDLLSGPGHLNFALEEGDIIYLPRRKLAKFGYVLEKTSTIASFAVLGTLGAR